MGLMGMNAEVTEVWKKVLGMEEADQVSLLQNLLMDKKFSELVDNVIQG